ncbi:molybdenum cofactor guanylyltransferase [Lederbergia wuyishanensis]|uniref:Probable molybdenum cofactor guanylyltransferase n=1 Tax=Lederbergia wuyishanensis TaxID=1347903 RepID=A0ABU0D3J7_9BACI|nr:molybdenum cofactor guanylyltransferase [Lederbergia wuyishanensis]MCJ8007855.1 molybdenum cofactor guanylyltransferase [Lederbergia wuyishanensis]MDQ0342977.1 molybdopterin-guanine dinucleotide biosynthesis protein A [Lederbergia wuyishanensis]
MNTIILAGGKSSRMGENKALVRIGGKRVIDRLIEEFLPVSEKVIVIANEVFTLIDDSVLILEDSETYKGQGPLVGILTGLTAVKEGTCLVVACDMPFASRELATLLERTLIEKNLDAAVPIADGQIHPLFAVYQARILDDVISTLKEGKRAVKSLLDRLNVEYIEIGKSLDFWNMNTREEYLEAKNIIEGNESD